MLPRRLVNLTRLDTLCLYGAVDIKYGLWFQQHHKLSCRDLGCGDESYTPVAELSLNNPQGLQGCNGGDPCEESWIGVACSGFSVIHLKIQGMRLTGSLGAALYNLPNLKI
ncbi:protein strubbelig-receptor family 2-like, partial [Trifolium pratense]